MPFIISGEPKGTSTGYPKYYVTYEYSKDCWWSLEAVHSLKEAREYKKRLKEKYKKVKIVKSVTTDTVVR